MKKTLSLALLLTLMLTMGAMARVQYDKTGRHIVQDDTIRGQRRAQQAQVVQDRKIQAAAAAKIDYEKALRDLDNTSRTYPAKQRSIYYNVK